MRAWVEIDATGAEVLVRAGTGLVTALAPAGPDAVRVEIECDLPAAWSRALRYTVEATVPSTHPLTDVARSAEATAAPVHWSATWRRHEGVPAHLPMGSLDLATDASSSLTDLSLVEAADRVLAADAVDW